IAQCFPDKLLAQAIAYKLKGGPGWTGEVLTSKDVDDTTYLYLYHYSDSSGISSVQGLQVFTNLTSLYLNGTLVSDVSPLSKLTNLTDLDLWYTGVSDVSPLSKLTNLNYLDLSSTQVSDVSPLSKLVKLKTLDLDGTRVRDLSPLSKLPLDWINSQYPSSAQYVRPSVKLTVNADGSVSLPAPRWTDGSFVAPSSTSPAGGVLDAKRGAVTWKGYDAKASYSYDFDRGGVFTGHVTGVKPAPTPKVYAVSFDSQGGSGVVSQRVTAGRRASRPADPAR
ncbi:leucine-rich repeat domain-containing protein, partial [Bifidobacterium boum]